MGDIHGEPEGVLDGDEPHCGNAHQVEGGDGQKTQRQCGDYCTETPGP